MWYVVIELDILIGLYHFSNKHLLGKMLFDAFSLYFSLASFILLSLTSIILGGKSEQVAWSIDFVLYRFIIKHSLSLQRTGSWRYPSELWALECQGICGDICVMSVACPHNYLTLAYGHLSWQLGLITRPHTSSEQCSRTNSERLYAYLFLNCFKSKHRRKKIWE